jgi:TRAP-type mannitol/chloroaromatic compound transport system substrate-binding protein
MKIYKNIACRQVLSQHFFALLLLLLQAGCAGDAPPEVFHWKLQSHATSTSLDYQELVSFAENVRLMSGGRLNISLFPGGSDALAHGPEIFRAVGRGELEMGNGWPNWWSAHHPAWGVMNAGPFDFMNLDASMMFFLVGEGTRLANELASGKGIIWRPAWWPGMEFGLLSREPITGLADLKGKKVRIGPGLPSEVLAEAADCFAIPLVPEEIRPAMSSGELDAVEWTTTSGAWDLGLGDLSPHAIVPAIWQPSVLSDFLINRQAYEALPADLRAILETAIHSYTLITTMKSKVKDIHALQKFRDQGTQINSWSTQDIERWRQASDKIIGNYKARDEFSRKIIESKQAFKNDYNNYYSVFGPYDGQVD